MTFNAKLLDHKLLARDTQAFYFEKPANFSFTPGQYCDLTILDLPYFDAGGATRSFSIASTPEEDYLMFATRLRGSSFKKYLKNAPTNAEFKLSGPLGNFILRGDTPAVFLAGGIGITPFISMILTTVKTNPQREMTLFYSNRHPDDAAFLQELTVLEGEANNFKLVPTMTQLDIPRDIWHGATGYINQTLLRQNISDLSKPNFYLAGPPRFVDAMKKLLADLKIPSDRLYFEEFAGY